MSVAYALPYCLKDRIVAPIYLVMCPLSLQNNSWCYWTAISIGIHCNTVLPACWSSDPPFLHLPSAPLQAHQKSCNESWLELHLQHHAPDPCCGCQDRRSLVAVPLIDSKARAAAPMRAVTATTRPRGVIYLAAFKRKCFL